TIDYDSDERWFQQPADGDIRQVCSETGLVPSVHCTNLTSDYFIPLISSTQPCHNWDELMISPDEKISYCKSCAPATGYKKKWYKIVEPEMQSWFQEHQIAYQ
ncbi:MAG TPA: penicillin-binding protein 1C, partial [Chitinophagaceae bacterium]|nr:penicillin-binding protein 1C [Chitinophagaceae bacterium]